MAELSWKTLSEVYGFLGNSLLAPMSMTTSVGLDLQFWEAFPTFGDRGIADAVALAARYVADQSRKGQAREDAVQRCAVEYTHLFIGPPAPAAPPWETIQRADHATVGFGQATFEMRRLLREANLALRTSNRQYEDHLGIELLYLSERCRRLSEVPALQAQAHEDVASFIAAHPLGWIESLRTCVATQRPEGYFCTILLVAQRVLEWHRMALAPR